MKTLGLSSILIALTVCAFVAQPAAGGAVHYVSPSGTEISPYTNWPSAARDIQKAINVCSDGDTVWVTNGTFAVTSQVSVTKGITVSSVNGATATAIDAANLHRCVYISATNAIVDGFTIQNGNPSSQNDWTQYGGGIVIASNGMARNCIITNNYGNWCGGVWLYRGGTIRNSLIAFNTSGSEGGGVAADGGGSVENCTIVGNQAPSKGAGICFNNGVGQLVNSIIYQNTGSDNVSAGGTVSYSCMTPVVAGVGNITNNPLFATGFRLSTNSPCLNTGTYLAWMAGATDLSGNPRITNGTVDMGAYEFIAGVQAYIWTAVEVGWYTITGTNYQVQATTNLQAGQWQNLGGVTVGNGGLMTVFDSTRTNATRCYRVVVP